MSGLGADKLAVLAIQYDASQPPGGKRARINIDSIRQRFRLVHRRVPMHDDLAKVLAAFEKLIANPQEILRALVLQ